MKKETLYDVVRYPVVTEKSTLANEQNKYIFKVCKTAGKDLVKKAVEMIFNVKVTKVNTINVIGKTKRFRGKMGKRNDYKKAVVTIESGQVIDTTLGA